MGKYQDFKHDIAVRAPQLDSVAAVRWSAAQESLDRRFDS